MTDQEWLAERFEENRTRLRAVAYRMLGSRSEAEDAVHETWLRLSPSDAAGIENLEGWLTTVTGRVCLDMLQSRRTRREEALDAGIPDLHVSREDHADLESETIIADSVGLALLVVLETLTARERLAFVLHDMFDVPFEEIASIVGCSAVTARQLASRARRRVQGASSSPNVDLKQQRKVVDAFLAAVRDGDFEALMAALDPDVLLRSDEGPLREIRGAQAVASQTILFSRFAGLVQPVIVNGVAGFVAWLPNGEPFSVMGFAVRKNRIAEIDVFRKAGRLRRLNLTMAGE